MELIECPADCPESRGTQLSTMQRDSALNSPLDRASGLMANLPRAKLDLAQFSMDILSS